MKALKIKINESTTGLLASLLGSVAYVFESGRRLPVDLLYNGESIWCEYGCSVDVNVREILLPIGSLKLCPFVAMREGVHATTADMGYGRSIMQIELAKPVTRGVRSIIRIGENWVCGDEVEIDLEWVTSLDGVEIIEVEE